MKKVLPLRETLFCALCSLLFCVRLWSADIAGYSCTFPEDRILTCPPTAKDTVPPVLKCKKNLSVALTQTGIVTVWPADFIDTVADNCSAVKTAIAHDGLDLRDTLFDPFVDLPSEYLYMHCCQFGPYIVKVWARDASGNTASCFSSLIVQDNFSNCSCFPVVSGAVRDYKGRGIDSVALQIKHHSSTPPAYPLRPYVTDRYGLYNGSIYRLPDTGYSITPKLQRWPLNGVSTQDLSLINRHILNIQPLKHPAQIIAADANLSGTVTTLDIVAIRKMLLGITDTFPHGLSWRFWDAAHQFADPKNPFKQPIPWSVFRKTFENGKEIYFTGVKIGDVNNTAKPSSQRNAPTAEDRFGGTVFMEVTDRYVQAGETVEVAFRGTGWLTAQQFTLECGDLVPEDIVPEGIVPVSAAVQPDGFALFPEQHRVTHAWFTERTEGIVPAFGLRFRAEHAGYLRDMLRLSDNITAAAAYSTQDTAAPLRPALRFVLPTAHNAAGTRLSVEQNKPNPANATTIIDFYMPTEGPATLEIHNAFGQLVFHTTGIFESGLQRFLVDTRAFSAFSSGFCWYQVSTPAQRSAVKKMIFY